MPIRFRENAISLILRTSRMLSSDNMHYVNSQAVDCIEIVECFVRDHTRYGRFALSSVEWIGTICQLLWFGRDIDGSAFCVLKGFIDVHILMSDGLLVAEGRGM